MTGVQPQLPEVRVSPDGQQVAYRLPGVSMRPGEWRVDGPNGRDRLSDRHVAGWLPMAPTYPDEALGPAAE